MNIHIKIIETVLNEIFYTIIQLANYGENAVYLHHLSSVNSDKETFSVEYLRKIYNNSKTLDNKFNKCVSLNDLSQLVKLKNRIAKYIF